jgi:hypothetical protein
MPRRIQDIVPSNHRSIRDIPLERNSISAPIQPPKSSSRIKKTRSETDDDAIPEAVSSKKESITRKRPISDFKTDTTDEKPDSVPEVRTDIQPRRVTFTPPATTPTKKSKKWLIILASVILLVGIVGYIASVYFSHATFTIQPKMLPISVNSTYVLENASGTSTFAYTLSTIAGSASANVFATDGQKTSTSAKGSVTLFNAYSAQPQQLKAGTRLSDDTGRIYRLSNSVIIPGYTSVGGKITPKSITTAVVADAPGASFNISKTDSISDLKIVAYKGTPRYETMYARLATDISGGFVGTKKTVAPSLLASTTADIQSKITSSLFAQAKSAVPDGYILLDDSYTTSFGQPVITGDDPKSATVSIKGTLNAILLKKDQLITHVATQQKVNEFGTFSFTAPGLEDLDLTITNPKEFSPEKKNKLIIKIKGDVTLVGTIPVDELKTKLAGVSLSETENVLRVYKPVLILEKSSGQIIPPWAKVPSDTNRIELNVLTK